MCATMSALSQTDSVANMDSDLGRRGKLHLHCELGGLVFSPDVRRQHSDGQCHSDGRSAFGAKFARA